MDTGRFCAEGRSECMGKNINSTMDQVAQVRYQSQSHGDTSSFRTTHVLQKPPPLRRLLLSLARTRLHWCVAQTPWHSAAGHVHPAGTGERVHALHQPAGPPQLQRAQRGREPAAPELQRQHRAGGRGARLPPGGEPDVQNCMVCWLLNCRSGFAASKTTTSEVVHCT